MILKPYGFSVILFAENCPKDNITIHGIISLRSNITRRMANKTAECPYEHSAKETGFFHILSITEEIFIIIIPAVKVAVA